MCGIVGAAGQLAYAQEKAFKLMLILDALRGIDSTGIAAIGRGLNAPSIVSKQLGNPYDLLDMPQTERIFKRQNSVLIGHNRSATQGLVSKKNAHPFDFDNLVGVHNGTLTNKYQLPNSVDYPVDSQALYAHMDKTDVRSVLDIIQGAWSLVWYDYNKHTLNFLRNKERPMFIAYDSKVNSIYWASEEWMVRIACSRAELTIDKPFSTDEDVHYAYPIAPDGTVGDPVLTPMAAKPAPPVYQGHQHSNRWTAPVVNNVVALPAPETKKDGVAPSSASLGEAFLAYANSKGVVLEVMCEGKDENGARYLMCYDNNNPGVSIRMFLSKTDKAESFIGTEIVADIGKYHPNKSRGYFKVEYNSVRRNLKPKLYRGHDGIMYEKGDWEDKYGECVWCGSPVFAGDAHALSGCGQSICSGCMDDEQVTQYVTIVQRAEAE